MFTQADNFSMVLQLAARTHGVCEQGHRHVGKQVVDIKMSQKVKQLAPNIAVMMIMKCLTVLLSGPTCRLSPSIPKGSWCHHIKALQVSSFSFVSQRQLIMTVYLLALISNAVLCFH